MTNKAEPPTLLLVDDDDAFRQVLSNALTKRGYAVTVAANVDDALLLVAADPPEYAVVDLKMPGASGLVLVQRLHELDATTHIIVLTGFASIATAVEAIKLGATHYLAKPAEVDDIMAALHKTEGDSGALLSSSPMSVERMEWEHIQRILSERDGNISATARLLNMHRRTLQRKLAKYPRSK
ncbi:MAG TPA: response regulator transcription factor [Methylophilaceae bacterium]|jgi:two-component system response regulator RegA